jgi:hypothetical protein
MSSGREPLRLTLEIYLDAESLAGRLSDGTKVELFNGWLGLASALSSVIDRGALAGGESNLNRAAGNTVVSRSRVRP